MRSGRAVHPEVTQVSGDPKKPSDTRKFERPPEEDQSQSDPIQLLAMVLGMVGMMLKVMVGNMNQGPILSLQSATQW